MTRLLLPNYEWAIRLAQAEIGKDDEVHLLRVESVPPSPSHDVHLSMFDRRNGNAEQLLLFTERQDINDQPDREETVRRWAREARERLKRKRVFGS